MRILFILLSSFILNGCMHEHPLPPPVLTIQKYKLMLPASLVKASGGFSPAIGSGIEFHKKLENGDLEFFAISDRGPNYPIHGSSNQIVSFYPTFSPTIARFIVKPKLSAAIIDFINIKHDGLPITGINPNQNTNDEMLFDTKLQKIAPQFGLDTESISIMKNGNLVIGDEYYPSINIVDQHSGAIIRRLTPGNGLPEILKHRNFNRGFEAVTVAPNDKIYAILEGALNLDLTAVQHSKLLRLIEIDLTTSTTKAYAYAFDYDQYKTSDKVKIGDITAIDDHNFLLVEQGTDKHDQYRNIIYKINIQHASEISGLKLKNGKELEYGSIAELADIKFVRKNLIFNPRLHGWTDNKLEGLALIDPYTIAIANDTDFAVSGYTQHSCGLNCQVISPIIDQHKRDTNFWIIKFKEAL